MAGKRRLTITGLGSGGVHDLTLGTWQTIQKADILFLRTADHPVVDWIKKRGVVFSTFDAVYEQYDDFTRVYETITERLIRATTAGKHLVYAVPGHPMVAERTTKLLLVRGPREGIDVKVQGGPSFLEQVFTRLKIDPIDGLLILDGLDLDAKMLHPRVPTVIAQVYDPLTASDVKLTLMERYPDEHEVTVAHALGVSHLEHIQRVPLYAMDHDFPVSSLSLIFIPPLKGVPV